jgi:signal transduction histidine kinase
MADASRPPVRVVAQLLARQSGPTAFLGLNPRGQVEVCAIEGSQLLFAHVGWTVPDPTLLKLRESNSADLELDGRRYTFSSVEANLDAGDGKEGKESGRGELHWVVLRPSPSQGGPLGLPRFAQHVVHALRNSLSSVKLAVQTLARGTALNERDGKRLRIASREVKRIERALTLASEFARPPARSQEPVDVVALLETLVQDLQEEFSARQVNLVISSATLKKSRGGADGERLVADPIRMRTAVEAMLLSAATAMGTGGHIEVRVEGSEKAPVLVVLDDGPALSEEEERHLFEPLWGSGRSGGLELAFAAAVARELGGSLQAHSKSGGGVQLTFRTGSAEAGDGHPAAG